MHALKFRIVDSPPVYSRPWALIISFATALLAVDTALLLAILDLLSQAR